MTTRSEPASLRTPRVYAAVLAATAAAVGLSLWTGTALSEAALALLAVAVIATGIPHGAIDHLVAAQLYDLRPTWRDQAMFYGAYLALMALYGALWPVVPAACLFVFLAMTMYHFGQADLAYWGLPPVPARLLYLSRGLLVIGLPIASFPGVVGPIFEAIGGVRVASWPFFESHPTAVQAAIIGQHAAGLGAATLWGNVAPWQAGREALNVAAFAPLFLLVHPLAAFAVYFGLWHSLGHILELLRFFARRGEEPKSLPRFYRAATLFTGLSFVLLGGLYAALQAFGDRQEMIALLFILIAVMTLPHMIIVERLYRGRERRRKRPA